MPPFNKYVAFGSTTISVPPKMVGKDKKNNPKLYNTLTPSGRLTYRNGTTSIKLITNPNTNRKIYKVPRSTTYVSMPRDVRPNRNGLIPAPPPPAPIAAPAPVVIPVPIVAPAPVPVFPQFAASRIQRLFRNTRYTREQLDAMTIDEIRRLLRRNASGAIIAPTRNSSRQYRDIFNAYQRKSRAELRSRFQY